ncbi:hypothetical protein [Aeromicrobium sp. NPDC092404]|uniref:hypothetical protein n=1 Tax=Aeromicrobium sp. NPDC092404 TaxID=3154976 RepID=UPI00341EBA5D
MAGLWTRLSPLAVISMAVAVLIALRLLMFRAYVGADEAGFLMVGTGWHDGSSLYGDYWVDRPPLLLWMTELAGGVTSLRVLGLAASVLTLLGIAWAAHVARGPEAARWAAGAAALFGVAQWLGVARVNGEMLAAPFVAWSIGLVLRAVLHPRWRVPAALGAGVLAMGALAIKQSVIEGFVFAIALSLAMAVQRRESLRVVVRVVAWGALGAAAAAVVMLVAADARGTSPTDLFDAVVRFRAEAGEVIRASASGATPLRLLVMMGTWAVSGLGAATVLTVLLGARLKDPLLLATAATLLCSLVIALFGGSYWAHYLIQMVPAASLAAGLLAGRAPVRLMRRLAIATVAVTAVNLVIALGFEPDDNGQQHTVGTWLREAREPADTGIITFGQPNVLFEAGMSSPYRYLWSLPVRTRDADLSELSAVIDSSRRPTWVVNWSGLNSWGIEPGRTVQLLRDGYRKVATICGRSIWLLTTETRTLPTVPKVCP